MEHCDDIIETGFTKPLATLKFSDREQLVKIIGLHHTIFKCKAELDQLCRGLQALGLLQQIRAYPDVLESLFVWGDRTPVTAGLFT